MGTITVPDPLPSPVQDCEALKKAFQGWGTDARAIIGILGHRTAPQRLVVARTYEQLNGESLVNRLNSKLSGDFSRAVIWWALDPVDRDAKLAQDALKKNGDRHVWVIIEIACASSPGHLMAVRQAYWYLSRSSLEEDVATRFPQGEPLGKMLVALVTSYRYDGEHVDEELARSEAAQLRFAIATKRLDHEDILRILGTRNKSQLGVTFHHYRQQSGSSIDQDISSQSNNSKFASLLKVAVWCLTSPEKHFAEVVRSSVVGLGTDEDSLSRAIISRAEIDMQKIKEEYMSTYKVRLEDDVIGDTSGYYREFLLTLLGNDGK
uniref:Annexin n=1 Tax=Anthurium amnicola TaxID=1678845 RepID=A0A1D1XW22_9ARAE